MSRIVFTNANLLDGERPAQKDATVIVEGNRIAAVGPAASLPLRADDNVVDLAGMSLMPGMVSGHYHAAYHNLGADSGGMGMDANITEQAYRALHNVQLALACGYTSLVGAGTHHDIDARLAEAIDSGVLKGARLIPSTRSILPSLDEVPDAEYGRLCHTVEQFRETVTRDLDRGAKIVKVFASGGHGAMTTREMTREELDTVVALAHERGARVRAHVVGRDTMMKCVDAGIDIIDHADGMDDGCIEAFVAKGLFVLPSLYLPLRATQLEGNAFGFEDLEDFNYMCGVLPRAAAAGVKLVPGDDFGTWQLPHGSYSEELVCYVRHAGVSPLEVIKWATKNGGELTGLPDLGTIEPGKLADLVVVDGDPSADITLLTMPDRIKAVVKDGQVVSGALPERQAGRAELVA